MNNRDNKINQGAKTIQSKCDNSSPPSYEPNNDWSGINDHQQIGANMEQNVLPDLMRVYDSLTQCQKRSPKQTVLSISTDSGQIRNYQPQEIDVCVEKGQHQLHHYEQYSVREPQELVGAESLNSNCIHKNSHQYQTNLHRNIYNTYDQQNHRDTTDHECEAHPHHQLPNLSEQEIENFLHSPLQNQGHLYYQEERNLLNQCDQDKLNLNDFYSYDEPQSSSTRKRFVSSGNSISGSDFSSNTTKPRIFKSRKKGINDERWSKRFTWSDEMHAYFASAIFEVGLKHASPSFILEHLSSSPSYTGDNSDYGSNNDTKGDEDKTLNAINIYLKKYRRLKPQSQQEFMEIFSKREDNRKNPGDKKSKQIPYAGAIAAYISFLSLVNEGDNRKVTGSSDSTNRSSTINIIDPTKSSGEGSNVGSVVNETRNTTSPSNGLTLPQLTDEEKQSPLGSAMAYFLGLFFSLQQQLTIQKQQS